MGWFSRRRKDFEGLKEPTAVRVVGELLACQRFRSPFTGVESVAFGWDFYVNTRPTLSGDLAGVLDGLLERRSADPLNREPNLMPCGEAFFAHRVRLDVDGVVVAVPLDRLKVRFRSRPHDPAPVDCAWAELLPLPAAARRGALYFVERMLLEGDRIELTATVEPVSDAHVAYRGSAPRDADFVVRPDLEAPVLVETG